MISLFGLQKTLKGGLLWIVVSLRTILFSSPSRIGYQQKLLALYALDGEAFHRRVIAFDHYLREFAPDIFEDVFLYHVLVGNTPPQGVAHFDFPGRMSIAAFIDGEFVHVCAEFRAKLRQAVATPTRRA